MRRIATLLFCLLASPAAAATGDGHTIVVPNCPIPPGMDIPDAYLTGADIAEATEATVRSYLVGFFNGLSISVVIGSRPDCVQLMHACIARYDLGDMSRQLLLYVRERPERLTENANIVTYNAIFRDCISEIL